MDWSNPLIYVIGIPSLIGGIYAIVRISLAIGQWKGRNDESVTSIKGTLETIQNDVKKIFRLLSPEAEVASPLRLTDLGREVSADLDGTNWAEKTASELVDQLRGKQPFEIDAYASEYVQDDSHFSDELLRKMQESGYNRALKLERVRNVLAIELRDALLRLLPDDG